MDDISFLLYNVAEWSDPANRFDLMIEHVYKVMQQQSKITN